MKTNNFINEQQDEEIKTIRERNISIKLSDADVERLFNKIGESGLTVSELFENFVGDLVAGTYSNGSDERMYANQWFDRCWFGMDFGERSFLQWLITNDSVSEAISAWNDLQDAKNELQEFQIEDESDEEYADNCREDISYYEDILNDLFNGYKGENTVNSSSTLESEMDKVMQWQDEITKLKDSKNELTSDTGTKLDGAVHEDCQSNTLQNLEPEQDSIENDEMTMNIE
jgi:hypothetical protein